MYLGCIWENLHLDILRDVFSEASLEPDGLDSITNKLNICKYFEHFTIAVSIMLLQFYSEQRSERNKKRFAQPKH